MIGTGNRQSEQFALRGWQHGLVFLLAFAVLVTRRPDAVFHAQFWAEDGRVFYMDAYNLGWWSAMFHPYDGYFHLAPRLVASLALLAPLSAAPLVMNVIAIAVQAIPVNLLLMARSAAWGNFPCRLSFAGVYLALPNNTDVNYGITNAQWFLAVAAFLILVASPANDKVSKIVDQVILLFSGLSGPFCIFLLPIAAISAWKHRTAWRWAPTGVLAACSLVQAWGLLVADNAGRPQSPLGASLSLFMRIIGGQIYFGTLLGRNNLSANASTAAVAMLAGVAIAGTVFLVACFVRAGVELRLLLALAAIILAASLISPATVPVAGMSRWEELAQAAGIHYWFFPTLVGAWSIIWAVYSHVEALRAVAVVLVCIMPLGIAHDWRHPALSDLQFAKYAWNFEAAPNGTAVTIPLHPEGWTMRLVKHAAR